MDKEFTTDGASLPAPLRLFIESYYPERVMVLIDRAGVFHDLLTYKHPNTATHNRLRFIKLLGRLDIPIELIRLINFGLWVYDLSPQWLKTKFKSSV